jgi:hypothetical protein
MIVQKYNPTLKDLLKIDSLPSNLGFLEAPLGSFLDKLFYQNLRTFKSRSGNTASYTLDIVTYRQLVLLQIPGTGIEFVLNPPDLLNVQNASVFNVSFDYSWEILKYIPNANIQTFGFDLNSYFLLLSSVFGISEQEFLEETINVFLGNIATPPSGVDPLQDFVTKYNSNHSNQLSYTAHVTTFQLLFNQLISFGDDIFKLIVTDYLGNVFDKFKLLLARWIGPLTEDRLKTILLPQFRVSINNIGFGIEFPRSIFIPLDATGQPIPDPAKSLLRVNAGSFSYNTKDGFLFEEKLTFSFQKSQILNSGFTLDVHDLKIDLSETKNIPEADADGRPADFKGVYVKSATIGFPTFWNHDDPNSTGFINATNLLCGTGGLSGTLSLQGKPDPSNGNLPFPNPLIKAQFGSGFEISLNGFSITFEQNAITDSSILGSMKIPGFKDTLGNDALINILIHIASNGDFSVTASDTIGITALRIPNVLDFNIKSLSIGRLNSRFFVAVSGTIDFMAQGSIGTFLPKDIEIKRLIIYDDGTFQLEGGSIVFPKAYTLQIGPAKLSITAIHLGSHEQQKGGVLRKYKYFGFDGGVNVNPGGVDARGKGIKFYFSVDSYSFDFFFRIESLAIDLIIPGNTDPADAAVIIHGFLSMKEPQIPPGTVDPLLTQLQNSTEYIGGVSFQLPKLKMGGGAAMRFNPKVPSFIIDIGLEISTPIVLGSTGLGIYGFRALFGRKYVASKLSVPGLTEDSEWWQYYKAKIDPDYHEGIQVSKFIPKDGLSLGAGVSLATAADSGKTFSSKLFFLLSMPDVFLFQGQAQILKDRIGLDATPDPPFFAFIAITKQSVEAAFGIDYKMQDTGNVGKILTVDGVTEMGFFFGNSTAWYFNIGRDTPAERRIQARVFDLFNMYFYFMISQSGIRAGAGISFSLTRSFGPLHADLNVYMDTAGRISFHLKQIGGSIQMGGNVGLYIFSFGFSVSVNAGLAAESSKPRIVTGRLDACVKVLRKKRCAHFDFTWNFDNTLNTTPVDLIDPANTQNAAKTNNILTSETLNLYGISFPNHSASSVTIPDPATWAGGAGPNGFIIPLDSFVDIEFKKGLKITGPDPSLARFGIIGTGSNFIDYIAPQRGKSDRVRHEYAVNKIEILYYNSNIPSGGTWVPFDFAQALSPQQGATFVDQTALQNIKFGYWQIDQPGRYSKLRVLAQTPISYITSATLPEDFGLTGPVLFCSETPRARNCINFDDLMLFGDMTTPPTTIAANKFFFLKNFMFRLIGPSAGQIVLLPYTTFQNALAIKPNDVVELVFNEPMASVNVLLKTITQTITVNYYGRTTTNPAPGDPHSLPSSIFTLIRTDVLPQSSIGLGISYTDSAHPVDRMTITPGICSASSTPLHCTTGISLEGAYLLKFFNVLVAQKDLLRPTFVLYDSYGASFLFSPLYNRGKGFTRDVIYHITGQTQSSLNFTISDKFGYSCDFSFQLITPDPTFSFAQITGFVNLRPDPANVQAGNNNYFLIDAQIMINGAIKVFTLRGRSCYAIAICDTDCTTYIYQICSQNLEDYQYNQSIPSPATASQNSVALINSLNSTLQPIWRPNTHYALRIELVDTMYQEGGSSPIGPGPVINTFVFGFKTAGPVGHYHMYPTTANTEATRTDYLALLSLDHEAEFKLSGMNLYIDYQKCYPNADGDLINAKPFFYKNPKLLLFYTKPYAYQFFNNWNAYGNLEPINSSLEVIIKDPAEPPLTGGNPTIPPAGLTSWVNTRNLLDTNKQIVPTDTTLISNMLTHGTPCLGIVPALAPIQIGSQVTFQNDLLPRKLYTAIYNGKYQRSVTDSQPFVREVHRHVFETSRYSNFTEQVNSYILQSHIDPITHLQVIDQISSFTILMAFSPGPKIALASQFVTDPNSVSDNLIQQFGHPYDRIMDGILQIKSTNSLNQSLEPAVCTEFNFIRDSNTGNLIGILLRNPEPFNDPKMPDAVLQTTLLVSYSTGSLISPVINFKLFFSKDNAKVFITNADASMTLPGAGIYTFSFSYIQFNGNQYTILGSPVVVTVTI